MIQENYVNNIMGINDEVKRLDNLAYSAHALSDTDIFESYVNMANWEFEPYVALSTVNATSKCNKKTMVKFPQYLGKVSTMNKNRRDKVNYEEVRFFGEKDTKTDTKVSVKKSCKKPTAEKVSEEKVSEEKKPRGRPKKEK
jgi:hypothetical protein